MEIDAGITFWPGGEFYFEFEVLEIGAMYRTVVKQMGAGAVSGEHTVRDRPRAFVFAGPPAIHAVAVEKLYPILSRCAHRQCKRS